MDLYAALSGRVCNMQKDLIIQKTEEFLLGINCTVTSKQYLKRLIVELVYNSTCNNQVFKTRSVYAILKCSLRKSERTILSGATKAIEDIVFDRRTREVINSIGIKGNISVANFLNAAAKEIYQRVESAKNLKGTWIG